MGKYICKTECYWNEIRWREGQIYEGPEIPPKHFVDESGVPAGQPEEVHPLDQPMTLGDAQRAMQGPTKLFKDGEQPKSLSDAMDFLT